MAHRLGIRGRGARDGEEALRLAGQRGPDLLLVDVIMPGIDGYEVCRGIRACGESAPPVIVITGHDWTGGSAMGLEAGAVDYMVKPFGRDELIACVGVALGLTRPMGQDALGADPRPLVLIADDDGVTCARVGAWLEGYMLKPFQQEELVACVRGALLRKKSVPDDPWHLG